MAFKETMQTSLKTVKSLLGRTIVDTTLSNRSWDADDVQGAMKIDEIQDGFVFTSEGDVIGIIEILPLNFSDFSSADQEYVADNFGAAFKMLPDKGQFKVMSVATNIEDYEKLIRSATKNDDSPAIHERVDNFIETMKLFQSAENSISKRFFYIFQYEGNEEGAKSTVYNEVMTTMFQTKRDVMQAFKKMGNPVVDLGSDSIELANVFYQFYNPKTCKKEKIYHRIDKVNSSSRWFGQTACLKDCVCPRGVRFGKWDYVVLDGVYHTYYILKSDSYPMEAPTAWPVTIMNLIDRGDIDLFYMKNNSTLNDFITDRTDVISRGIAHTYDYSDNDRGSQYMDKSQNAKLLKELQKQGDDVYDVCMIVTLRADTFQELQSKRISFLKETKRCGLFFNTCYLRTNLFFDMVTPLCSIDYSILKANRRNATNTSLASFYFFAAFEMFDQNGFWLGQDAHGSLFGFDNFNTKRYTNPHISIFGKTGAGKTVTQLMIASRMRMMGIRNIFILPLKGHEYKDAVESLGGVYIPLFANDICINVCEIRPAEILNSEKCNGDEELLEALKESDSLLSLKVEFLINWIRIQLDNGDRLSSNEIGELNTLLVHMYNNRGITDDNLSIFERDEKGNITSKIKKMPIIEDIYNLIPDDPRSSLARLKSILSPWVNGSLKHMNGQTNISLENECIAFDVNEDKLGRYLPAFMLIGFETGYAIARRDMEEKVCITLDETWKFLVDRDCAAYIFKMLKILRSYSTSLMCATQQITDCMRNEDAKAMLSMPDIKIILRTDKREIPTLAEVISLSEADAVSLPSFGQGDALFCFGTSKMKVHFWPTLFELFLYEPKESIKKKYLAEMEEGNLIHLNN